MNYIVEIESIYFQTGIELVALCNICNLPLTLRNKGT